MSAGAGDSDRSIVNLGKDNRIGLGESDNTGLSRKLMRDESLSAEDREKLREIIGAEAAAALYEIERLAKENNWSAERKEYEIAEVSVRLVDKYPEFFRADVHEDLYKDMKN